MGTSVRPVGQVIGPGGTILTFDDLPPKNTRRWVPRRKAEVIAAVDGGLLTLTEACARYAISQEEFSGWIQAYARHGLPGLRAGQLMDRWAGGPDADPAAPFAFPPGAPPVRASDKGGKITN